MGQRVVMGNKGREHEYAKLIRTVLKPSLERRQLGNKLDEKDEFLVKFHDQKILREEDVLRYDDAALMAALRQLNEGQRVAVRNRNAKNLLGVREPTEFWHKIMDNHEDA